MNFELKTLSLVQALNEKCDALLVMVPASFEPGTDSLSSLISQALKGGDLEAKPGKLLQLYGVAGVAGARVVVACVGDGSVKQTRQGVAAAVGCLKGAKSVKKAVLVFAAQPSPEAVACAVVCAADASYVFTTTKSKPEGRTLATLTLAVADSAPVRSAFDRAASTVRGIEFAKEWGNRPANHATPTLLAQAAKSLAK